MFYNYYFWGMHWIWWVLWLILIVWIFAIPYRIPGERLERETPIDILKRRFAEGQITRDEYEERKEILLKDKRK
ncbi:MAG TPA: SHOCT domain-containing protein [Puia sp.]|nr:SHOCT domain-containing protein [Puia sp.]